MITKIVIPSKTKKNQKMKEGNNKVQGNVKMSEIMKIFIEIQVPTDVTEKLQKQLVN